MEPPTMGWFLSHQSLVKKTPTGLHGGKSYGGIFWLVPSSQITPAFVKVTYKHNTKLEHCVSMRTWTCLKMLGIVVGICNTNAEKSEISRCLEPTTQLTILAELRRLNQWEIQFETKQKCQFLRNNTPGFLLVSIYTCIHVNANRQGQTETQTDRHILTHTMKHKRQQNHMNRKLGGIDYISPRT